MLCRNAKVANSKARIKEQNKPEESRRKGLKDKSIIKLENRKIIKFIYKSKITHGKDK